MAPDTTNKETESPIDPGTTERTGEWTENGLDLLVLGGTSWLGGAVARAAQERGHRVTCLARGAAGSPPQGVTWVWADRSSSTAYDEVAGRDWDAVVDVTWQPDFIGSALTALAPRTGHWVYVSSCSAYVDDRTPDAAEDARLHPPHAGSGRVDASVYGPAKVACEEACLAAMGAERVAVARAGLIGGYGDRSDRLGYWPARIDRAADGERVLVPPRHTPVQVVDVEDLARWLVHVAENRVGGAFNAVGEVTTIGAVLDASSTASGRRPTYVEASHEWLAEQGVQPWMGPGSLPLWLPQPENAGAMTRRNTAARAAGMSLRPLAQTVAASLRWEQHRGLQRDRRDGLTPGREAELLDEAGHLPPGRSTDS